MDDSAGGPAVQSRGAERPPGKPILVIPAPSPSPTIELCPGCRHECFILIETRPWGPLCKGCVEANGPR